MNKALTFEFKRQWRRLPSSAYATGVPQPNVYSLLPSVREDLSHSVTVVFYKRKIKEISSYIRSQEARPGGWRPRHEYVSRVLKWMTEFKLKWFGRDVLEGGRELGVCLEGSRVSGKWKWKSKGRDILKGRRSFVSQGFLLTVFRTVSQSEIHSSLTVLRHFLLQSKSKDLCLGQCTVVRR